MADARALVTGAIIGRCPRCGARTLFDGIIAFAPACRACHLDFSSHNVGDGAAALAMLVIGALIVPAALVVHFTLRPPLIVDLLLWPLVATGLTLGLLRVTKAALITAEHQRGAREGRLVTGASDLDERSGV